jgi:hypothetical protein
MSKFTISFALLFSLFIVGPQPSVGQETYKPGSPEEVTRQFYQWYLSANCPNPKRSNMPTFRKFVTQGLLKRATARDVESLVFVDAQDTDETWAKNFTVSKATIVGQKATLEVALNGKEMKYKLNVTLRREGNVWKIDNVKGSDVAATPTLCHQCLSWS